MCAAAKQRIATALTRSSDSSSLIPVLTGRDGSLVNANSLTSWQGLTTTRATRSLVVMYALTHDLARRRVLYARPLPTLPDVMVIDVPPAFAHPSLPLGRFYPILMETEAELAEVEAFVTQPRKAAVQPDLLDHRSSGLFADRIIFAAYDPPESGWPHLLLCHWPPRFAALAGEPDMFARGAYTTEMFDSAGQLAIASTRLLSALGNGTDIAVTLIPAATHVQGHA